MTKGMTFTEKDEELIRAIIEYQHKEKMASFAKTVRQLCKKGLIFCEASAQSEEKLNF